MSDPYALPGGALRNKLGITAPEEFVREEYRLTEERLVEFSDFPTTKTFTLADLCGVHRRLFGDVYDWAGDLRTTLIGKQEYEGGGRLTRFADPDELATRGAEIFSELRPPGEFLRESPEAFVQHITEKYNEANLLHPFREGNGRALRAFFAAYAEHAGYKLSFEHISKERWLRASVEAGFGSDGILSRVFRDAIDPLAKERFRAIEPLFDEMQREGVFHWNDHYIAFPAPGQTVSGLIAVPGSDVSGLINDGRIEIIDTHILGRVPEPGEEIQYTEPDRHPSQQVVPYIHPLDGGAELPKDTPIGADLLERSEVFGESMRRPLLDRDNASELSGRVVWLRDIPGSDTCLALIDTGERSYSRVRFTREKVDIGDTVSLKPGEKALEVSRVERQGQNQRPRM